MADWRSPPPHLYLRDKGVPMSDLPCAPVSRRQSRTPVVVLLAMCLALALWMLGDFGAQRRAALERQADAPDGTQAVLLRHEAESAQRQLTIAKAQAEDVLKVELRQRGDEAVAMAQAIHAQASGRLPAAEVQALIRESLRPLRFFSGRGYYFIDGLDGRCVLLPTVPRLEGTSLLDNRDDAGRYIMRELIRAVDSPAGAGYVRYSWYAPEVVERMDDKIAYARRFPPYGWLIGTGEYTRAVAERLQAETLERMRAVRLAGGGRLVVIDENQVIRLFPPQPLLEGSKLANLPDSPEARALTTLWRSGRDGTGIARFALVAADTGRPQDWLAWTERDGAFDWMVAAMAASDAAAPGAGQEWMLALRTLVPTALLAAAALWLLFALLARPRDPHGL